MGMYELLSLLVMILGCQEEVKMEGGASTKAEFNCWKLEAWDFKPLLELIVFGYGI